MILHLRMCLILLQFIFNQFAYFCIRRIKINPANNLCLKAWQIIREIRMTQVRKNINICQHKLPEQAYLCPKGSDRERQWKLGVAYENKLFSAMDTRWVVVFSKFHLPILKVFLDESFLPFWPCNIIECKGQNDCLI